MQCSLCWVDSFLASYSNNHCDKTKQLRVKQSERGSDFFTSCYTRLPPVTEFWNAMLRCQNREVWWESWQEVGEQRGGLIFNKLHSYNTMHEAMSIKQLTSAVQQIWLSKKITQLFPRQRFWRTCELLCNQDHPLLFFYKPSDVLGTA